ncbi:MAG: O-antigen polysaccharide polymerase Wzy [Gemmatimonadales bacterium]
MTSVPAETSLGWSPARSARAAAPFVTILLGVAVAASAEIGGGLLPAMVVGAMVLVAAAAAGGAGHRMGWLSPSRVFLSGAALYLGPSLATVMVVGALSGGRDLDFSTLRLGGQLSLVAFGWAAVGVGLAGLLAGMIAPSRPSAGPVTVPSWFRNPLLLAAGLFGSAGALAVATFVFAIAGVGTLLAARYGERYQVMAGYGALILGAQTVSLATFSGFASGTASGRRGVAWGFAAGGAAFHLGWTALVGARTGFVQLLLGLFVIWQALGGRIAAWKLGLTGVVVLGAGLVVGAVRAGVKSPSDLTPGQIALLANPANSEFGATLPTVGDIATAVPIQEPYRFGSTYLAAFGVVVPRALWPSRPQGAAEWYVQRFYPDVADIGGAFAFSPVAEAYLNFGKAGVVVVFLGFGLLVGLIDRFFRSPRAPAYAVAYGLSVYSLLIFSRLDTATLVKSHFILPYGQLLVLFAGARIVHLIGVAARRKEAA